MEPQQWKSVPVEYRRPEMYEVLRANALGAACLAEPHAPHAPRALSALVVVLALRCVPFRRHRR
jgi:hypothetical protein